jgi:sialate O-acetylesterase
VIWYQGEADGGHGIAYRELFPRLISGWRALWGQGDFPFLFVQLPANQKDATPVATGGWPFLREAQLLTLQRTPKTGMAITLDIGDPKDVHPQNKEFAAARLALVGRKVAYGEPIVASGPLYAGHEIAGSQVRIRFSETGGGLTIGQAPWIADGNTQLRPDKLTGFYLAGSDGKWFEGNAAIEGDAVIVSSPEVSAPAAVRYGWANSPRANLYNREGLAASPFRTDDWAR